MRTLSQLQVEYPLSEYWAPPNVFVETTTINGLEIGLVGLSVCSPMGQVVTGSAAEIGSSPVARAYFELLERASIVELEDRRDGEWISKDSRGNLCESIDYTSLVPTSADPDRWRYARSNGVAVGSSWGDACRRAERELVERDRILRSWYGEEQPTRVGLPNLSSPAALGDLYLFEAYLFGGPTQEGIQVAGVFGFPTEGVFPILYGFGANDSQDTALHVAWTECIQRLGFLWGEPIGDEQPQFSPTPDFHQEVFLRASARSRLRDWLAGRHRGQHRGIDQKQIVAPRPRRFVDITPVGLATKLSVAKALPDGELPLVFGDPHPLVAGTLPEEFRVHPIM